MIRRTCFFALLVAVVAFAGDSVESPLSAGFQHFYNNEYDQALAIFESIQARQPDDPAVCNAIAQTLLYREMFRDGALESELVTGSNAFLRRRKLEVSPEDKAKFDAALDRALTLVNNRLRNNENDVEAWNAAAVAHGLRANFLYLVNKSWMQALHEAVAARKANDRVLKLAPEFVDAHLLHGLSEYVVGSLPGYLRLVASFDGFHGDKEDGLHELRLVYEHGTRNRYDAAVLLAALYRRERRPKDALPLVQDLERTFPRNYLFPLEEVQMYSDAGNQVAALAVLGRVERAVRTKQPGFRELPLQRVEYARGNLLFWYGNLNASLENLQSVTAAPPESLDLATAVMARLRLGQVYDLLDDREHAREAYRQAITTAPDSDPAREAASYLKEPFRRKTAVQN